MKRETTSTLAKRVLLLYRLDIKIAEPYKFCILELLKFFDFDPLKYKPYVKKDIVAMSLQKNSLNFKCVITEYYDRNGRMLFSILKNHKHYILNGGDMYGKIVRKIKGRITLNDAAIRSIFIDDMTKLILLEKGIKVDDIHHYVFETSIYNYQDKKRKGYGRES